MVSFGVLGPLEARNERGPVNLKGPRHRAVVARLLVARGRVVPVRWLIDDLWDDPPEGALGAVQTFIGEVRKALEPDRPPRTPSRLLVTVPPGYALRTEPEAVDALRFEAAVAASGRLLADDAAGQAHSVLDDVLSLWRGPAYAEFQEQDWASGEAARLHEIRLLAVERRAEAALTLGKAAEAVPDLEALVAGHPLREDGWRLLALALYRTGRQGDALAALRRAREALRAELGVDPGQSLRQLEADVLAQEPRLSAGSAAPSPKPSSAAPKAHSLPVGDANPTERARPVEHPFVGRSAELAQLMSLADNVATTGLSHLVLVSGVAGAGKTALARTLTQRLKEAGWTAAWGTSPEFPGAPASWSWSQISESLAAAGHLPTPPDAVDDAAPTADPAAQRFHRHRAIAAFLSAVSASGPVVLVFDDLHWADEETLTLLTSLVGAGVGPVLMVATYRSTEISAALAEVLSRTARAEPARIYLGGLTEAQVHEMVQALTDRHVPSGHARMIHRRSAGNPFFVRELTRLLETDGEAALHSVPTGVRDVVRHRLAALTETARTHLRQAAVLGHEVDLDVLIALAGDEDAVLDSVESALVSGFLVEPDANSLRFAHALVRETLYDDVPGARRAQWHAAAATIIEDARPSAAGEIAHHLLRAGTRVPSARIAHYARAAAELAERRFAPHSAAYLWQETITALDRAAEPDARGRLEAIMGMVRALAVTGDLQQARRHRVEAVAAAESLGDPVLTARVIGSFDVPANWTTNDDEALSARLVAAAEHTLAVLPVDHAVDRARLLVTIAMERRADSGERGSQAAREAETIARGQDDPALLASALNGRFMQTFHRAGLAAERAEIGVELLDLSRRHHLVTYEVLGHLILIQSRSALGDLTTADQHAAAADLLAERHDLPLVGVFTEWYAALRLAVAGRTDEARTAYRSAAGRLAGTGMTGLADGILPLALLSLDTPDTVPAGVSDADWGPYLEWARPLVLLAQGSRDQALSEAGAIPDSPRDLLLEARLCLHAVVAVEAGDRSVMERLYAQLLPAAGELAGAGSGLLTVGPVATYLGQLSSALGHARQAADHYRRARTIADQVGAPHWVSAADRALRRFDS